MTKKRSKYWKNKKRVNAGVQFITIPLCGVGLLVCLISVIVLIFDL